MLLVSVAPLLVPQGAPRGKLAIEYKSREGLTATLDGVPVIQGSSFQFYAPGWSRGYYSSRWNDDKITKIDDGYHVEIASPDHLVTGTLDLSVAAGAITSKYRLVWNGDEPAKLELNPALLYAEPWRGARQNPPKPSGQPRPKPTEIAGRILAQDVPSVRFDADRAALTVESPTPGLLVFDANGYAQGWAEGQSRLWAGYQELDAPKGQPVEVTTVFRFDGGYAGGVTKATARLTTKILPNAIGPVEGKLPLIPKPAKSALDYARPLELTGAWTFPAGRPRRFDDLLASLRRRFDLPLARKGGNTVKLDGGIIKMYKRPGAYRLSITPTSVTYFGEEDEGVLNAAYRLAQLAFTQGGKLYLPTGTLEDEPRREFRGVHLFVGPQALDFQQKLWTRVLGPLGFNKVVLQCERTAWNATPNVRGGITMPKTDLAALFDWYRTRTAEPIPLVQSFGHMEWAFDSGKNLDLAFNPQNPYALDPRKATAKSLLKNLWDEVAEVTKAKTFHFGLDEVDMRGFDAVPGDRRAGLVTDLWQEELPFLGSIAKSHGAEMMLWGDKGLAPGEAPDAALGDDKANAQARRDAIPKGAYIADWHYLADPKPQTFLKPLQIWRNEGYRPIASAWYRPENIRGFYLAADLEGAGTLQTTWAGYESNEANMLREIGQFNAMVLAADYSWSARQDNLNRLGYDPVEVFRRMYFGEPSPLSARPAIALSLEGAGVAAGPSVPPADARALAALTGVTIPGFPVPIALRSLGADGPLEQTLTLMKPVPATRLYLQVTCATRLGEGEPVARAVATLAGGGTVATTILYGLDVVALGDAATTSRSPSAQGLSLIRLDLPKDAKVTSLRLLASAPHTGLVVRGALLR